MLLTMCIVVSVPAEFAWYAPNPLRLGSIEPEHIRSSKCAFRPRSASRLLLRTVYSNFATMAPPPIELNVYNPDTHILNIINVKQASVESIQSETKKRELSTDGSQFFLVSRPMFMPGPLVVIISQGSARPACSAVLGSRLYSQPASRPQTVRTVSLKDHDPPGLVIRYRRVSL